MAASIVNFISIQSSKINKADSASFWTTETLCGPLQHQLMKTIFSNKTNEENWWYKPETNAKQSTLQLLFHQNRNLNQEFKFLKCSPAPSASPVDDCGFLHSMKFLAPCDQILSQGLKATKNTKQNALFKITSS